MPSVKELNPDNFDEEVLSSIKPFLVDFWAPWCQPCQDMAPILDEFAGEVGDQISIGKLNVEQHPDIAEKYNILSIPNFALFSNGNVEKTVVGSMDKERLYENFRPWLL